LKRIAKQPVTYSKRTTVMLYALTVLIVVFLVFGSYYKRNRYADTVSTGKKLKTVVTNVWCTEGKGRSSLYFVTEKGEVQHVNVSYRDCQRYKRGDTIQVSVSKTEDWYEIDPASQLFVNPEN
jgi:hypothetical protein